MKKKFVYLIVGVVLIAAAIFNFTMDVENKGHYFGNGIVFGIGISVIVIQIMKMRKLSKQKRHNG